MLAMGYSGINMMVAISISVVSALKEMPDGIGHDKLSSSIEYGSQEAPITVLTLSTDESAEKNDPRTRLAEHEDPVVLTGVYSGERHRVETKEHGSRLASEELDYPAVMIEGDPDERVENKVHGTRLASAVHKDQIAPPQVNIDELNLHKENLKGPKVDATEEREIRTNRPPVAEVDNVKLPEGFSNNERSGRTIHQSRLLGSLSKGAKLAKSAGAGVVVEGAVEVTKNDVGTGYSANVEASRRVGPGTVSLHGGAAKPPGSNQATGKVGVSFETDPIDIQKPLKILSSLFTF